MFAVLALLVARNGADVATAIEAVPWWALVGAVGLHVVVLIMRSEAWGLSIAAVDGRPLPRRVLHRASSAAFLAGTLQSQAALPARVAMLRRMAGDDAPRPGQIAVADVPIFAIELVLAAALLVVGVAGGLGSWWSAAGAVAFAIGVLVALTLTRRRYAHRPIARGLAVLADRRRRGRLAALVAGVCAATVARIWLVLVACGLPHTAGEVGWLFAALGAFGLLPAGPGAPAGATLATLGTGSVGAAVAAGLVLSATSIAGVLVYGCAVTTGSALLATIRGKAPASRDAGAASDRAVLMRARDGAGPVVVPRVAAQGAIGPSRASRPCSSNARKREKWRCAGP